MEPLTAPTTFHELSQICPAERAYPLESAKGAVEITIRRAERPTISRAIAPQVLHQSRPDRGAKGHRRASLLSLGGPEQRPETSPLQRPARARRPRRRPDGPRVGPVQGRDGPGTQSQSAQPMWSLSSPASRAASFVIVKGSNVWGKSQSWACCAA
jgi:hypothetical protein